MWGHCPLSRIKIWTFYNKKFLDIFFHLFLIWIWYEIIWIWTTQLYIYIDIQYSHICQSGTKKNSMIYVIIHTLNNILARSTYEQPPIVMFELFIFIFCFPGFDYKLVALDLYVHARWWVCFYFIWFHSRLLFECMSNFVIWMRWMLSILL